MTSTQIQYFLEVANSESYTKAAEKLYVSHQVLSTQIKALEKELKIELIDRSNKRRICLTDAGRVFLDACKEMQGIFDRAVLQARKLHEADNNSLVVGIQDMRFVRSYVVPLIRKLQDQEDAFNLEYRLGSPTEMFSMLDAGEVDMLFMISSDVSSDHKYHRAVIRKEALHLVAAMSKNHPLAKKKTLKISDLKNETILMIGESYSGEAAERFRKDLEEIQLQPKKIKYFNGPRAINIAVETEEGVALLFDELLEEARDQIKTFPIHLTNAAHTDMLLVWKDPKHEKAAQYMIELEEK